ncbi:MAG TPA: hypothetical protein VKV96_02295 [Roseiarcus sp.]|nr:hypothetical protein [Roseiarcus sp.]
MPYVSQLYFKTAIMFLIVGIGVGLQMGISGNHNVIGAHAHINLLGWVTSALFGVYYTLNPAKAQQWIAKLQYGVYVVGVAFLVISLYFMLLGNAYFELLVVISSLVVFAGVILFAVIVYSNNPAREAKPDTTLAY